MKIIFAALILISSLFTACNLIFPETAEFVEIKKAEWDLIEDFTDARVRGVRPYLLNGNIEEPNKVTDPNYPNQDQAFKNNQQALHNTRQIQAAIDHYMAQGYKNIRLETGEYYVGGRVKDISWGTGNQEWGRPESIRIQPKHSGLRLDLNGSTLKYEPQDRVESSVISISSSGSGSTKDIKIFNGTIIGDRVNHRYHDPYPDWNAARADGFAKMSSHEDGSGISIYGDVENVEIYNMNISEVTGDCIFANGRNITIRDCDISRGRRNGIVSVFGDGYNIYNNRIHCIYNAGVEWDCRDPGLGGCRYCTAGHPNSEHEYFGRGIGAEACIAFEHTNNNYIDRQINIKIYNNKLDGQKPRYRTGTAEYLRDSALNTHWATYAMWVYNNDIIGDWEWSCGGSNTLIENNRFLTRGYKGYVISRGLIASGPTSDTGRSAASYVVIRNNYFHNYNVIVGGASGGVSDSQPDWRHDYAIVDNVFVYDQTTGSGYETGICASVNNTVVIGNVFNVSQDNPLRNAIYIDVFNSEWGNRLPANLKVDLYIANNTYIGRIWREKGYVLNGNQLIGSLDQYERPTDPRFPGNYSESNNYQVSYAKYQEILKKTISVGNIWGNTK